MARILKFNSDKAEEQIARMKEEVARLDYHLAHLVDYTVEWFKMLQEKYGAAFPRRTELRNLDTIDSTKVIEANEKLYINREEGFIGTGLKKDEFVANCSNIDDIILFFRDGRYLITPVADKKFVGKNILYANVFKKNDKRTIYNVVYRDGKAGTCYIKRFAVTSVVRDREYDLTQGTPDSRIVYFSANPNGEAEVIKVTHQHQGAAGHGQYTDPQPRPQDYAEAAGRLHPGRTAGVVRPRRTAAQLRRAWRLPGRIPE